LPQSELFNEGVEKVIVLSFLKGLEEEWGDFAGLVVGDGVVG
jgi:hypothetical protein